MKRFTIFFWQALKGSISFWKCTTPGFFGLLERGAPAEYFSTLPRGVLHRRALKESFSVPPWRSASTPHLGGVHHLAELTDYIRVWFFGSCSPLFFSYLSSTGLFGSSPLRDTFGALHTGAFWKLSPACGFLRALHLRAF